eukprot:COSAG02_NODE_1354_length_13100_cov_7.477040_12_plen_74_part_00
MGPIRKGKFGTRALSLDDSPPAIHSYGISIQTPGNFEFWNSKHRTRQYLRESPIPQTAGSKSTRRSVGEFWIV